MPGLDPGIHTVGPGVISVKLGSVDNSENLPYPAAFSVMGPPFGIAAQLTAMMLERFGLNPPTLAPK